MRRKSPLTPELAKAAMAPLDIQRSEILTGSPPPGAKAALRAHLDSIQPEIERAARNSEAIGTLRASAEAQKRLAAEKAREEKEAKIADAVSIVAAKEKERAQRKNAAPVNNGPTPERAAKLMTGDGIGLRVANATKAHEAQNVVEFYNGKWTDEELQGARHLVQKWNDAEKGHPTVTPAYTGVPGSGFGARNGGIRRGKTEHFVSLHQEVLQIEGIIFAKFGSKGLNLVRWFCWETVLVAREGAALGEQMEAAGKSLAPFVSPKNKDRLWGLTFGHLMAIFRFAYSEWVVKEAAMQQYRSSPQQIANRRAHRVRRMEQEGLLHAAQDGPAFPKREGRG